MKNLFILFLLSQFLFSCKKDSPQKKDIETCDVFINTGRLKNPYSITEIVGLKRNATHVYEKVVIHSIDEYNSLIAIGAQVSFIPFEMISENVAIEIQTQFPVVYAVVPVGIDLSAFQHKHVDDLFMPDKSNKRIEDISSNSINGNIKFLDPITGLFKPVEGIKVLIKDVTKQVFTYTDINGDFDFVNLELLSDTVQVLLEFSSNYYEIRTLDAANLQAIVFPNKFSLGYKKSCGLTNMRIEIGTEYPNSQLQHSVATLLALNQYKKFATENQFLFPTKKMVIWLGKNAPISTSYSAPMLNNIAITDQTQIQGLLTQLFGIPSTLTPLLYLLVKDKLPDIYAPYFTRNTNNAPNYFVETLYHEYSHASHYAKTGNDFWNIYIQHIFENGGYGDGTQPNSGMIALSEAWAEDVSYYIAYQLSNNQRYLKETEKLYNSFIPYGIYNDLHDNTSDTATVNGNVRIFDFVSGVSFTNMYQLLSPTIQSPEQFKQVLKTTYTSQAYEIDSLYSIYGY